MKTSIKLMLALAMAVLFGGGLRAQDVAIKTNLLHDAGAVANLGIEFGLAPKWSLDISTDVNYWPVKHGWWGHGSHQRRYWERWWVQPEARYWFCEKFQGSFLALQVMGGMYNVGNIGFLPNFLNNRFKQLKDERWKGWGVGAGIAYGYAWSLGTHWNIEAEIGIGWIYSRYDRWSINKANQGKLDYKIQDNKVHNYVGPTKLAVNLVYVF